MNYLVADHREGAKGSENWAQIGSPVVPNYPISEQNTFLGVIDFKAVPYARVVNLTSMSLDDIAARLKKQFPGLPSGLHDTYVLETAKLCLKLPIGTICQIFVDEDTAKVKLVDSDELYTLWTQQPISAGYV